MSLTRRSLRAIGGFRTISTPKDDRALTAGLPLLGLAVFGPIACLLRRLYRAFQFEEVLTSVRQSYKRAPSGSSDTGIARRCRRCRLPSWPIPPGRARQWSRDPGYN